MTCTCCLYCHKTTHPVVHMQANTHTHKQQFGLGLAKVVAYFKWPITCYLSFMSKSTDMQKKTKQKKKVQRSVKVNRNKELRWREKYTHMVWCSVSWWSLFWLLHVRHDNSPRRRSRRTCHYGNRWHNSIQDALHFTCTVLCCIMWSEGCDTPTPNLTHQESQGKSIIHGKRHFSQIMDQCT